MFVCAAPFPYLALGRYTGRRRRARTTPHDRDARRTRSEDAPAQVPGNRVDLPGGRTLTSGLRAVLGAVHNPRTRVPETRPQGTTDAEHTADRAPPRVATGEPPGAAGRLPCPAGQHHAYVSRLVAAQTTSATVRTSLPPQRKPAGSPVCKQKDRAGSTKAKAHAYQSQYRVCLVRKTRRVGVARLLSVKVAGAEAGSRMPRGTCDAPARMPCCRCPHGTRCLFVLTRMPCCSYLHV